MTWLERDDAPERDEWLARAMVRAFDRANLALLDTPDEALSASVKAERDRMLRDYPINVTAMRAMYADMDAWEYGQHVADHKMLNITAPDRAAAISLMLASLDLFPPRT